MVVVFAFLLARHLITPHMCKVSLSVYLTHRIPTVALRRRVVESDFSHDEPPTIGFRKLALVLARHRDPLVASHSTSPESFRVLPDIFHSL